MSSFPKSPARILIVDDHPIVRQGYEQMIGNQPDLEVCGSAINAHEALELISNSSPDLVVVDISLKDSQGIELVREIKSRRPQIKALVVSAHDENLFADRALQAGALGYVNKQEAIDKLIDAIRKVLRGEVYLSEAMTRKLLLRQVSGGAAADSSPLEILSNREMQVYQFIGQGLSTREIAEKMHLSPKTIERYKENIKSKLNIANATELVQHATKWTLEAG